MALKVFVKFEGDPTYTEITKYVMYDSVKFDTALCTDKFKAVQDLVKMRTIYDKTLNDKFFQATNWLPAYITNDQETEYMYGYDSNTYGYPGGNEYGFLGVGTVFTGAIFPSEQDTLKDYPEEGVYFEILDNNYKLEQDVPKWSIPDHILDTWYVYNPADVSHSFVHQLLLMAGVPLYEMDSSVTIINSLAPIVVKDSKQTFYKLISEVLYEYHFVHYFDNNGIFRLYNWKHDALTVVDTITEDIVKDRKGVHRSRNILNYNGFEIEYTPVDNKENALVYRESLDTNGKLLLHNQTVPANGEQKDVFQTYSSNWLQDKDSDIIFSSNHKLELTKDDGINVIAQEFEVDRARIVLKNESGLDKRLYQFDIRADVIFENGSETLTLPSGTTKREPYKCKFVRTEVEADNLANALYNNMLKYGKYKYEFESEEKLLLGAVYTLETRDYIVDVLVIAKSWNNYTRIFNYTCIGVGNAVTQSSDVVQDVPSVDLGYEQPFDPRIRLTKTPESIVETARGLLRTTDIIISAFPTDLTEEPNWYCTDGDLTLVEIDDGVFNPYQVTLDCASVEGQSTTVICEITEGGQTYAETITIDRVVVGDLIPIYLGALNEIPSQTYETPDGPIIIGDHFLFVGEYIGDDPENDPNYPAETQQELEDLELARALNPPMSAEDEYIPGRMYAWNGIRWTEDRNSQHLGHAYSDALNIARNTNRWLYVAVLIAQLGLFQDLIAGRITSARLRREGPENRLVEGFSIDGDKGLIEAYGMRAWDIEAYGTFLADGFRTLQGGSPTIIQPHNVSKTVYKYSDFVNEFATGDDVLGKAKSGNFEGYTFNRALRQPTDGMILAYHGEQSENISAGEVHYFTALYPSKHFGSTFRCHANGYYKGVMSERFHGRQGNNTENSLGESYNTVFTKTLSSAQNYFRIRHSSYAWWGERSSWAKHTIRTNDRLNNYSMVLLNVSSVPTTDTRGSINSSKLVSHNIASYMLAGAHQFAVNGKTEADITNYCSGEDFYALFGALPVGADGFASGKIKYAEPGKVAQEYDIMRVSKTSTHIAFIVAGGQRIVIDRFLDATAIGAYSHLEVKEAITYAPLESGIEVKNIMPMGFSDGDNYPIGGVFPSAIGGQDDQGRPLRFAEIWVDEIKGNRATLAEARHFLPFNFCDNLDSTYPLELQFYIPSETSKINKIVINIRGQNYRGFVNGIGAGGGEITLTFPTFGSETSSAGNHTHGYSVPTTADSAGLHTHSVSEDYFGNLVASNAGTHSHTLSAGFGSSANTGANGGHSHSYTAPDGVSGAHGHNLNIGIFESSAPQNVNLYCDNGSGYGSAISLGSSATLANNLDLTIHFSGTGWKKIKLTSTQRGRISASLMVDVDAIM